MKTYEFEVVCASGATKIFTCQADSFKQARQQLVPFVAAN